jgi:predicted RND superfamily exporter protein
MDKKAASLILKLRIPFLVLVCLLTVFFAWRATHLKLSYDLRSCCPEPSYVKTYQEFQEVFGEQPDHSGGGRQAGRHLQLRDAQQDSADHG